MVECYLQKIVEFITNKCPSPFIKIINLHLDVTRVNAGSVTKSTPNFNHAFSFHYYPSLWNSSASPAEMSCSSAVMRATISSTASGA